MSSKPRVFPESPVEFWSSVAYPQMLGLLSESLSEAGLLSQHRYYYTGDQYRAARTRSERIRMRLGLYLGYPLQLARRILFRRRKPRLMVVTSNTFYAPWWAAVLGSLRGIPVIHLVLDTFPDALVESGKTAANSITSRCIAAVTRGTLARCAATVFIGQRLRLYVNRHYGQSPRETVIPLAIPPFSNRESGLRDRTTNGPIRILYCGNLGNLHDIKTLTRALTALPNDVAENLDFRFHASGPRVAILENQIGEAKRIQPGLKVTFGTPLPDAEWEEALHTCEVGLVTMRKGAEKVLFPSKTFSAMAAGQAILAVCPRESDLGDLIQAAEAGWQVSPGEVEALVDILTKISNQRSEIFSAGERAQAYARQHLQLSSVTSEWLALLGAFSKNGNDD